MISARVLVTLLTLLLVAAISPVSRAVVSPRVETKAVCSVQDKTFKKTLRPLSRMVWSPDGQSALLILRDSSLWVVSAKNHGHAELLSRPVRSLGSVTWSPDGRWILVEGERRGDNSPGDYPWDTLWLVAPDGKSPWKDLLPPGSPFKTPGRRQIQDANWLDDDHVYFSMQCGTGCLGHYDIDIKKNRYQIFCIGSGQFAWAPNHQIAVAENPGSGPDPIGIGLVTASSAVNIGSGDTPFQYDRACKSVFSGGPKVTDPGETPRFAAWLDDGRHVLYVNTNDFSLHVWDTESGARSLLIPSSGP